MLFALVQCWYLAGSSRELTRISNGGAIPRRMERMGLVARKVCKLFSPTVGPQFFDNLSTHQVALNIQFALVQSSHLANFSRELTRNSIGGGLLRWMGRMGLVARRSLYAV